MAVNLSSLAGVAWQFFDNSGSPLSGGLVYTYEAGTSTPATTYTSISGIIAHSNPIVLDASGRVPGGEIWLTEAAQFKFVIKTSAGVQIGSYDNITGYISSSIPSTITVDRFTGTGAQVAFTLTTFPGGVANTQVYINGVYQDKNTYSLAASTITFSVAPPVGSDIEVIVFQTLTIGLADSSNVSYNEGGIGAVTTSVQAKLQETLSVKDFGAIGDGVADDTAAIQNALDVAKITRQAVYAPAGVYSITQIAIPSGIQFYGDGVGGYGAGINPSFPYDATVFVQPNGVNDDAIVFDCPFQSGQWRLFHNYIHDFIVLKAGFPTSDTIGNGISARQVGLDRTVDANHTLVNGITVFARILIRGFPENGMFFKRGAVPLYCYDLDFIFNAGYGLRLDGTNYSRNIIFRNLAGDGNKAGATVYIAGNLDSQVTLDGIYGEYRSDAPAGNTSGFNGAQPRAIEIGNFGVNSSVYIANVLQESIVTNEAAEACIYVNTSSQAATPKITFNTCVTADQTAASGGKHVLFDNRTSFSISADIPSGQYNINIDANGANVQLVKGYMSFGNGFTRPFVGDSGLQINSAVPQLSWFETDQTTNQKGWQFGPSSGNLFLRTFNDDGSTGEIAVAIVRSGISVTEIQLNKPTRPAGGFLLPTYANNAAALAGGLVATNLYKTATGEVRIVV